MVDELRAAALTLAQSFSWAKLVYTIALLVLIFVLANEIRRLWWDPKIYISAFDFFEDGVKQSDKGKSFPLRVIDRHRRLTEAFRAANDSGWEEERSWTPRDVESPYPESSALADLDVTVYDVKITDILAKLREYVSAPRKISGIVEQTKDEVRVTLRRPPFPGKGGANEVETQFVDAATSLDEATFYVACGLLWSDAARTNPDIAAVPREEYCNWTHAWLETEKIKTRHKRLTVAAAPDKDTDAIANLRSKVSRWIEAGVTHPMFYTLRADLTELMLPLLKTPEEQKKLGEPAEADRLRYAVLLKLDPKLRENLRDPLDQGAAYQTLAEVRPAIRFENGKLADPPTEAWRRILSPHSKAITQAEAATCRRYAQGTGPNSPLPIFTVGFLVDPNLLVTSSSDMQFSVTEVQSPDKPVIFSCGDRVVSNRDDADAIVLKRPIHVGNFHDGDHLALFEVEMPGLEGRAPLHAASTTDQRAIRSGEYVALVGYPVPRGGSYPRQLADALLGSDSKSKRLMPGRIVDQTSVLAATPKGASYVKQAKKKGNVIFSDVSSLKGTSGGPLVDLASGKVIGVHFDGFWGGIKEGKFAVAQRIDAEQIARLVKAAKEIDKTVQDQADETGGAATDGSVKAGAPAARQ